MKMDTLRRVCCAGGIAGLLLWVNVSAQERIVPIASGQGVIEQTVNGDAAGRASNPNTVYQLERDGYYTIMTPISNTGFHLKIRAAAGSGKRPIVRPEAGTARCFLPTGDLTLEGLYVNAVGNAGTLTQNSLRTSGANIRIVITDCHFDRDLQSVLRVESAGTKWFVRRSYISNLGLMADNNGRMWDDRGQNVDTVVFEDNVIYNLTGRMTRDGGGLINYFKFNHNTCVNVFSQPLAIGEVVKSYVTNNLFVNTAFSGNDTLSGSQVNVLRLRADTVGGVPQIYRVQNNNFYTSPSLISAYPVGPRGQVIPLALYDSLSLFLMRAYGDSATNLTLPVTFLNGPRVEIGPMQDYWNLSVPAGSKRNMYYGPDSGRGSYDSIQVPFDFRYSTSNPLYTAAHGGQPVGALFIFGMTVGVEDAPVVPSTFALQQNYPNPFNPNTVISYQLSVVSEVNLRVYDMLGREVAVLVNDVQNPGRYTVNFDAADLSSGMYMYRITAGTFSSVKKMLLMK